jgi:hypothetical protein
MQREKIQCESELFCKTLFKIFRKVPEKVLEKALSADIESNTSGSDQDQIVLICDVCGEELNKRKIE